MTITLLQEHKDAVTQSKKGRRARLHDPEIQATLVSTYDGSYEVVQQLAQQFSIAESTIRSWAKHLNLTQRSRSRTSSVGKHGPSQYSLTPEHALAAYHDTTLTQVDIINLYLRDVSSYSRLTAQEEHNLGERIAQNDQKAKHALILANLPLVIRIAKNYASKSRETVQFLDLIQEGTCGLIHAASIYDVTRGFRFSTHATWWIRQAVIRAIQSQRRTIRVSIPAQEQLSKIHHLRLQADEELTPEDIAERLSLTLERVYELLEAAQTILSLDDPTHSKDGNTDLSEIVAAPSHVLDGDLIYEDLKQQITRLLDTLPPRDRQIIVLRFGLEGYEELTLEQIGELFGITKERVRQVETRVLQQLRSDAEHMHLRDYLSA